MGFRPFYKFLLFHDQIDNVLFQIVYIQGLSLIDKPLKNTQKTEEGGTVVKDFILYD